MEDAADYASQTLDITYAAHAVDMTSATHAVARITDRIVGRVRPTHRMQ